MMMMMIIPMMMMMIILMIRIKNNFFHFFQRTMAKSLRSKWKRKMRAVKRVRYGEKVGHLTNFVYLF